MLDPMTAFGFASNIVQILAFVGELVSETRAFVHSASDSLPSNQSIVDFTETNKRLSDDIQAFNSSQRPLTAYEAAAQDAAERCGRKAASLLVELERLKVVRSSSKAVNGFRALRQSLRSARMNTNLQTEHKRLCELETQVGTALLNLIVHNQETKFEDLKLWIESNNVRDGASVVASSATILAALETQKQEAESNQLGTQQRLDHFAVRQDQAKVAVVQAIGHATTNLGTLLEANSTRQSDAVKRKSIMKSLRYREMKYRRNAIIDAHTETFKWCFDVSRTPLYDWLQNGDGIFWVCGKAGSGKSTFMRFLSDKRQTRDCLNTWKTGKSLIFAEHYFWYAGSSMEKSHLGLLRSLLHQILASDGGVDTGGGNVEEKTLISCLRQNRWFGTPDDITREWSYEELISSLHTIATCDHVKVFMLIDGLDEYYPQSDHMRLVSDIQRLSKHSNVKMCVSSRPWNEFEEAFGMQYYKLCLEDLTRADIARYTRDNLHLLPSNSSSLGFEPLVWQVTEKAKGVFLWVYLIVWALRERLVAGMSFRHLQQCIDDFPNELEDYFRELIYNRIHKTWRIHTAQALKLAMVLLESRSERDGRRDTLPTPRTRAMRYKNYRESLRSGMALRSPVPFWILSEGMETVNFSLTRTAQYFDTAETVAMASVTKKYLNACCRDLLCVIPVKVLSNNAFLNHRVEFLHRTVYDFLCSGDMQQLLDKHIPQHFNSSDFSLRIAAACAKVRFRGEEEIPAPVAEEQYVPKDKENLVDVFQ